MKRVPVERSSTIVSVGYNKPNSTLDVEFKSGEVYRFTRVPPIVHEALMKSDSKGKFLNENIKDYFQYFIVPQKSPDHP